MAAAHGALAQVELLKDHCTCKAFDEIDFQTCLNTIAGAEHGEERAELGSSGSLLIKHASKVFYRQTRLRTRTEKRSRLWHDMVIMRCGKLAANYCISIFIRRMMSFLTTDGSTKTFARPATRRAKIGSHR